MKSEMRGFPQKLGFLSHKTDPRLRMESSQSPLGLLWARQGQGASSKLNLD